ncbi:MAG: potassium transporter [Gammaproteobacteria bacterium]|nr:TrkH family potassium uptake protein [Gammaproteobacteria bacterium]MCP5136242.1 potassium transporter [Gammaproteobacteria bacterium]
MQFRVALRILGLLLMVFSTTMLPPLAVAWWYGDGGDMDFIHSFLLTAGSGFVLWALNYNARRELRLRDGFVIVVMFWTVLGSSGALPFMLSDNPHLSLTDAFFESFSGLTTTGATIITHIDDMPHALLFYRQFLQWLGGMGIIVLAVAILPMLGIGGLQLYRAETPGPMKDSKLTPRITETAKALWYIYLTLTVSCSLAYWASGMAAFDAIGHAFSTVAIGGFSTHDASIGHYQSPLIESIAVVFMLISGLNFALHFVAVRRNNWRVYWRDEEARVFLLLLGLVSLIASAYLWEEGTYETLGEAVLGGVFQAVSIGTTTGFTTAQYHMWPGFLPVLLLFVSFIGGCSGSTGGGMKVIRVLLLVKQGKREILRLIHPNAMIPVKVGGKPLGENVISAVWGFFALYVAVFSLMLLAMMALGLDQVTAFSAVAATINNLGPGLGDVGTDFASLPDSAKWISIFAMLLGRLEIFTLLVLFTPAFWRR